MKHFVLTFFILVIVFSCKEKSTPVAIIFDTDIAPDYDDVGALAMLHAFADQGEADVLATMSSNAFHTTAPTLSVINTYFNRPNLPVGVVKTVEPNSPCPRLWAERIISKYPHAITSNEQAMNAVDLYRNILSSQPDTSVTIVSVGSLTNLAQLLRSQPDAYSALEGRELVRRKVKRLVSMAAAIDSTGYSGYESNVMVDIPAAQEVVSGWPTPITISGFEIGVEIFTGMTLINSEAVQNSPVKDAYKISLTFDGSTVGRYSWDQTAVLVAVRGIPPYFDSRQLDFVIKNDGKDSVIAGNRIAYLLKKQRPEELSGIIEDLMMHQPSKVATK